MGNRLELAEQTKWEVYGQVLWVPYYVVFDRYVNRLRVFVLEAGWY